MKRKALGKGLSSLIPSSIAKIPSPAAFPAPSLPVELRLEVSKIRPNPRQPRHSFDEASLDELARSLRAQGLLQPVVVRPLPDGRFELIAGERRWRAAQRAGIHQIPAVVRDVPDEKLLELALIENLQREELNAIEEAEAYRILIEDLELTQNDVAERVGKQRTTVANTLRLLNLPDVVKNMVRGRLISMGHARALLALEDAKTIESLARRVAAEGLSVRQVESWAKHQAGAKPRTGRPRQPIDPNVAAAETTLQRVLGTKVRIEGSGTKGRVEIHYHSAEELDRVYQLIVDAGKKRAI
jgi:ParB family transcriptional regulator, chromosome partitioning protein